MTTSRRGALLLAVPVLALSACSSSSKPVAANPPSLAAVPTAAATSASPSSSPSPSPTKAASTAAAAPGAPAVASAVTGAGTSFTAPATPTTKKYDSDCGSLVDAGFRQDNCIQSSSPGGAIAAFVEVDETTKEERDLVYKKIGSSWSLVQRRIPDKGAPQSLLVKSDLNDDGDPKAVFTEPSSNESFSQQIDVIDTSGLVVIHLTLNGGFAKASPGGGLEAWYPSTKDGYLHVIIRYLKGTWTVISQDPQSQTQAQAEEPSGEGGFTA